MTTIIPLVCEFCGDTDPMENHMENAVIECPQDIHNVCIKCFIPSKKCGEDYCPLCGKDYCAGCGDENCPGCYIEKDLTFLTRLDQKNEKKI